jgi:hypothetical protein
MTIRKDQPDKIDDIETPHSLAVEPAGDGTSAPLPLLDDMKGILQWD